MKKKITIDNKMIAALSIFLFVLSMIPIWYLGHYARPSGDDYGYSVLTHTAWLETHSLIEVFKAGIATVKQFYNAWNGDWFTTFLFSLMPEVFAPYTFWTVTYMMTGILIICMTLFLYEICVRILKMPVRDFVIYDMIILFISYQFMPSAKIGIYWYVGAVHYIVPHAISLLAILFAMRYCKENKARYIFCSSICTFMVGGSSYFSCLLIFITFFALMIVFLVKNRKVLWLLIPFIICFVGFIIQCKSPGNKVRAGEDFGLDFSFAFYTIIQSVIQSFVRIGEYIRDKTFIFVSFVVLAVFLWESLQKIKTVFNFRYPALFLILMYGCYCSMFAPAIYASVDVSQGPVTMEYLVFILTCFCSIVYIEGWIIQRIKSGRIKRYPEIFLIENSKYRKCILLPVLYVVMLLTIFNRGWFRDCIDKQIFDYVVSGQAEDFKNQIKQQMEILLDDSVKEAYLVPINDEQGPLMHMPVTDDEDAFTNWVVKNFYHKDKVLMIKD